MLISSAAVATLAALVAAQGVVAGAAGRGSRVDVPRFTEEAVAAGIEHMYDGSYEFFVGGGVAAFDCDANGLPDLYFAGGSQPAGLYRNESPAGGALSFTQVESAETDLTEVTGGYPLDIDSDGETDLAVLRFGEDVLLRGLGDCAFERANETWGFEAPDDWTTAFSATWEAGETWPTLAFGNYIDHTDDDGISYCATNHLVRPAADGEGFAPATALDPGRCTLSMLFSDWDRSGRRDLRVSNDKHYYYDDGEEQLWRVVAGEAPRLYSRDEGWEEVQIWGMGIASQDLTGDGYPEVYLTSIGSNLLETLADGGSAPTYKDMAFDRGISATTPWIGKPIYPSTSWHPEFDDVNNDGRLDLYVSKGNVDAIPDNAAEDPDELFLGLPSGDFRRSADRAGIGEPIVRTRGASLVDLNADGLLDLVEVNRVANVSVWRNLGGGRGDKPRAMGHWLGVKLAQDGSNRDAIGAWVKVRSGGETTEREVTVGGGHAGGELGPIHFGLGKRDSAEVRVTWPDGDVGPWQEVDADQVVELGRSVDVGVAS
jgi:enediyne biosynthesis protein E4